MEARGTPGRGSRAGQCCLRAAARGTTRARRRLAAAPRGPVTGSGVFSLAVGPPAATEPVCAVSPLAVSRVLVEEPRRKPAERSRLSRPGRAGPVRRARRRRPASPRRRAPAGRAPDLQSECVFPGAVAESWKASEDAGRGRSRRPSREPGGVAAVGRGARVGAQSGTCSEGPTELPVLPVLTQRPRNSPGPEPTGSRCTGRDACSTKSS